ncbi:MAG: hypothetical protein DRQ55_14475 [Planctomycetota bacterium]|nr:MAG: hypothetical protein DRQ55_14475 [Planctomycetota bacterium]
MKRLICACLLFAVGCASVENSQPPVMLELDSAEASAQEHVDDPTKPHGIQTWIPGIFSNLFDIFDADIGGDYGFGVHLYATNFARVGLFDYADFGVVGIESSIFEGEYVNPLVDERWSRDSDDRWDEAPILDLRARFGIGVGVYFGFYTWEVFDFASSIVGFGYWSLDDD